MVNLDNPILNSPFARPSRHWGLDDTGSPTGAIIEDRRRSEYIVPIATSKRKVGGQEEMIFSDIEGTSATTANDTVDEIRANIDAWRRASTIPAGVTHETARLIMHWRDQSRERPLFFCQVEAVETIIWLTEVASKSSRHSRFLEIVKERCEDANPGLFRLAMKLATGAGKTAVVAMLIAWHAINKARRPNSKLFSDAFLIIAPGITIRDRLRVLMPEAPDSIYDRLSIVPRDMFDDLKRLCCKLGEGAMRDQGASCSPYDSALARRSCSHAMASVRAHGPRSKARSTIRASPTMPPWRANIPAWPLRSARITSKPLIVA